MKKFLTILVLLIALIIAGVIIFKDIILKIGVEKAVTGLTGFPTTVQSIQYHFPETIHVKGLLIKNPKGFEGEVFTEIPEIFINVSLQEILKKERVHVREIRLDIQQVNLERNHEGVTNLQKLSSVGTSASGTAPAKPAPQTGPKEKAMPFLLDKFVLTMRKVSFKNRGQVVPGLPAPGTGVSMDMNVKEQVFTNIEDPLILVNLIVMKIVQGTTFGRLAGIDPQKLLGEGLQGTFKTGEQLFTQTRGLVTQELGNLKNTAGGLVADPGAVAGKFTGTAKDLTGSGKTALNEGVSSVTGMFGKLKSTATGGTSSTASETTGSTATTTQQ